MANTKKKVQMPSGIRNKLMAAVAMLLVSSILMVSTTYAWFTLSTAPEVTGITTSVGANGNLEMALLTSGQKDESGNVLVANTYADLSKITSAVGDSTAATGDATKSNLTWGNLVDLSDASYGLSTINLQPARLKLDTGKAVNANPLVTPIYGADGRVATINGTTYTTATYSGSVWNFDSANPTYGVRAIGANDNLTPQQSGLIAAKAAYNSNLNSAKSAIQSALSTNGSALASAVTTLAMNSTDINLTTEQETAVTAMVTASKTALRHIDTAYKQVLLAAASALTDSTAYSAAESAITGASSYSAAVSALNALGTVSLPSQLTAAAAALATQQTAVTEAEGLLSTDMKGALNKLVDTTKIKVNGYKVGTAATETSDDMLMVTKDGQQTINPDFMNKVIADSGAIVQMPDGSGVFAYVGKVAGNYSAGCKVSISYKGLTLNNMNATMKTVATVDTTVTTALNGLSTSGTSTGATALSDTYGYALDFAFRTNASGSKLQLQTEAKQRVYSESTNEVTQGGGATMTFTSLLSEQGAPYLTDTQVAKLMGAIRVAFINPETGDIYGIAALDNIGVSADGMKGELVLMDYAVGADGKMTLTPKTVSDGTQDDIMELPQNTAVRMTVVVWMDGDLVDNGDVANAAQSMTGSMNLQFSSSATLQPMKNTALKNIQAPTTPNP